MKENAVILYFCTGGDAFSQKNQTLFMTYAFYLITLSHTSVASCAFLFAPLLI